MATPAIVVQNLTKQFPVPRPWRAMTRRPFLRHWMTALAGIDVEVREGEIFGLLGQNGAGKTTLLKILSTLLLPTAGHALINGYDVVKDPQKVKRAVGYCLDTDRSFYYRLTGMQNLAFFATLNNLSPREAGVRIAECLATVGLNGAARLPFMTFSQGMQQKLGLARALLTDPAILLLDEPTGGLDPGAAAEFRRFLRHTLVGRFRKTILLVTHSLEEARECCDRLAILDQGKIACLGTWAEVQEFLQTHGFPGYSSDEIG